MSSKLFLILAFSFSISLKAQDSAPMALNQLTAKFDSFRFEKDGRLSFDREGSGKYAWKVSNQDTPTEKVRLMEQTENAMNGAVPRVQLRARKSGTGGFTEVTAIGPMDKDKASIGFFHAQTDTADKTPTAVTRCENIGDCYTVTDAFCGKVMRTFGANSVDTAKKYVVACYNMPTALDGKDEYGLQDEATLAETRLKEMGKDVQVFNFVGKGLFSKANHGVPNKVVKDHAKEYEQYQKVLELCKSVDYEAWLKRNPATANPAAPPAVAAPASAPAAAKK